MNKENPLWAIGFIVMIIGSMGLSAFHIITESVYTHILMFCAGVWFYHEFDKKEV